MSWTIKFTKRSQKEVAKLKAAGLSDKARSLVKILKEDPYRTPPPFEKLRGEMKGAYSRRINIQHRLVYELDEDQRIVKIVSVWSHYE